MKRFELNWEKLPSGWFVLTDITDRGLFNEDEGLYVIGCARTPSLGSLLSVGTLSESKADYETIAVGQGEIGNRLRAKHGQQKYVRRANGRKMIATFVEFEDDDKTDQYRNAIERFLGKHYGLDNLGDSFPTSPKRVTVSPPW